MRKYGGYHIEYCARKVNIRGATLIRLLKAKDFRFALNFILTVMDALILHQVKIFCDSSEREGCSQNVRLALDRLKSLNWDIKENRKELLNQCIQELKNFTKEFFRFIKKLGEKSENMKLLNDFVWQDCSALVQLLLSIQTGNTESRNLAMKRIIPMFFR